MRRSGLRLFRATLDFLFQTLDFGIRSRAVYFVFSLRFCKLGFHLRFDERAVVYLDYGLVLTARSKFRLDFGKLGVGFCAFNLVFSLCFRKLGVKLGFEQRGIIRLHGRRLLCAGRHFRPYSLKFGVCFCALYVVLRLHSHALGVSLGFRELGVHLRP